MGVESACIQLSGELILACHKLILGLLPFVEYFFVHPRSTGSPASLILLHSQTSQMGFHSARWDFGSLGQENGELKPWNEREH